MRPGFQVGSLPSKKVLNIKKCSSLLPTTYLCTFSFFVAVVASEYYVDRRADQVLGLLHGECYSESDGRSGADGVANRLPRLDDGERVREGDSRNCSCIARLLSRDVGVGDSVQSSEDLRIFLEGKE